MWPEKAIFFTQRLLSLSLLMLIQPVVLPSLIPAGTFSVWLAPRPGLKVDRRPGELYIAAVGAELNAFDYPADGERQRQVVGFIARHSYHAENFMVVSGRRGDK